MSASISLTFEELPLVTVLGKSSFHLMSVEARLSWESPREFTVREIWSDVYAPLRFYNKPLVGEREVLDPKAPLWHLIAAAIYDTQADYVEREIRDEIRARSMEDA